MNSVLAPGAPPSGGEFALRSAAFRIRLAEDNQQFGILVLEP